MREKLTTAVCGLLALFPWTILPLRARFRWALDWAEWMIPAYAVGMILFAVLTVAVYAAGWARNGLMKAALAVHLLYLAFGLTALAMIYLY